MDDYALSVETADAELPPALAVYAAHLLRRAHIRANRVANHLAPEFGVAAGQGASGARDFQILDALDAPAAYSQQDLGERLGINRTTMVKLIDRLEQAGQVTRARNPGDRRSYVLALTDDGRSAVKAMEPVMAAGDDHLTAALTAAERVRLDALLSTLLARTPPERGVRRTSPLIAQAHHFVRRRIEDALTDVGLQARHFGALTVLADEASSQQRLARRLGISEQAILQIVDDLESAGRVVRERDPRDRRRYALRLTDAGRDALATARRAVEAAETDMGTRLGTDGRAELKALLTKMLRAEV
ncbi:MarR family winged helix-turn-helix transcriptional regulator [Streptomyces sp. CBMA29]|uniref:MarR family winged helix-turn-helix transcriptional regulator n=1 Tax=Streptomyces sp. CBMA29 TaxID=1896314 RepID=UPI001661AA1B|nr:MarR family transcriptional regulator [Streptomyces sp. CBMA29]